MDMSVLTKLMTCLIIKRRKSIAEFLTFNFFFSSSIIYAI